MRYIAVFERWDGKLETINIGEELIDDIVLAIEGQFYIKSRNTVIHGARYKHVDIFEA